MLCSAASVPRVCFYADRHKYVLSNQLSLAMTGVAVVAMTCAIGIAVRSINLSMRRCREVGQTKFLQCIQHTIVVTCVVLVFVCLVLFLEQADNPMDGPAKW